MKLVFCPLGHLTMCGMLFSFYSEKYTLMLQKMYLYLYIINDYFSHFSNGSTVTHFNLNLRPYDTNQVMNMRIVGDEIRKMTKQLEKVGIPGYDLTKGYIDKNTFTAISSGKYNKPILFKKKKIFISIIKSFVSFVNCLCVCIISILPAIAGLSCLNDCFCVLISFSYCCP